VNRLARATPWALPWILAAPLASADETANWALVTGVERSDNITRVTTDETSETTALVGLVLGIDTVRPRLVADISADLQYREYLNHTYENELLGGLDGTVTYQLVPERLAWVIEDNFAQIAVDGRLVDTPDNRQNVNYFTTGPDITLPLGARTALQVLGRYSDVSYEETPEDNEVMEGSLALVRQVSTATTVSLVGTREEIRYDRNALYADKDLTRAFLRLVTESRRASFSVDLGYSVVDVAQQDSEDGPIASLNITLPVAARSRLTIEAGTELATTEDVLRRDQDATGVDIGIEDVLASADVFQSDYAYLSWDTELPRGSFGVAVNAGRETHDVEVSRDREIYGANIGITRSLSPRVEARIAGRYEMDRFLSNDQEVDELTASIGLLWRVSREFSISLRYDHIRGTGNDDSNDYVENVAYVGFSVGRALALGSKTSSVR